MSGIHNAVLLLLQSTLTHDLITIWPDTDTAKAGIVVLGDLQGDPVDPDVARISVECFENDPDNFDSDYWSDEPYGDGYEGMECGGVHTTSRYFTVKARCLLERTREDLPTTRDLASILRSRIEDAIEKMSFSSVVTADGEYVSRKAHIMKSKMLQAGGPPDAFDYHIKIQFEVLTTSLGA